MCGCSRRKRVAQGSGGGAACLGAQLLDSGWMAAPQKPLDFGWFGPHIAAWTAVAQAYPSQLCAVLAWVLAAPYHADPPSRPL